MTAPSAQRLCIRLDPAMLLEGLLLERLARVPKARRQEWLRGLLVQGYLWEGRTSRGVRQRRRARKPWRRIKRRTKCLHRQRPSRAG